MLAAALGITAQTRPQTISFPNIPDQLLGIPPFPVTARATSDMAITFTSNSTSVCKVSGSLVLPLTTGQCSISATQPGDSTYLAATPVTKTFQISQATQSGTFSVGTSISTGTQSTIPVIADFNNDGYPDAAIANSGSSSTNGIAILLGQAGGGFNVWTPITVASPAYGLAAGDFNHDGNMDLAATNWFAGKVAIFLGSGDGNFTSNGTITVGTNPYRIAVGDFNADGEQDLAIANYGTNNVSILIGNGQGGFTPGSPVAVGSGPYGIVAGDFNGDGKQDFATVNKTGNSISIMLGLGSGTFTEASGSPVDTGANSAPQAIAVGDFNGDGISDITFTENGPSPGKVGVLPGTAGSFGVPVTFSAHNGPMSVAVGDFNGDGRQDIVAGNFNDDDVTLLVGNGSGGFAHANNLTLGYPIGGSAGNIVIAVGDFNHDGREDILATLENNGTATILSGALTPTTAVLSSSVHNPDVQGVTVPLTLTVSDSGLDFNTINGTATFYDNGTPINTTAIGPPPYSYTAPYLNYGAHTLTATFDGGGGSAASTSNSVLTTMLNANDIDFQPLSDRAISDSPNPLFASATSELPVTLTSDTPLICTVQHGEVTFAKMIGIGTCSITASQAGDSNHVPAANITRTFQISKGDQSISFFTPIQHFVGSSPFQVNAQSDSGLPVTIVSTATTVCKVSNGLVQPLSAGACSLTATQAGNSLYNAAAPVSVSFSICNATPAGELYYSGTQQVGGTPVSAVTADFDDDGIPDIAILNKGSNNVTVLLASGYGDGSFNEVQGSPFAVGSGDGRIVAADFNGDGFPDIAITRPGDNSVDVLIGDGSGSFYDNGTFAAGTAPKGIVAGDFNGDGVADLAVTNPSTNKVTILTGDGFGDFTAGQTTYDTGTLPVAIAVADFDGDGRQDLAIANGGTNNVTVLKGDGAGGFTAAPNSPFAAGAGPSAIAIGDFNHDGKWDFAVTDSNSTPGKVTVMLGDGAAGFSPATGSPFAVGTFPSALAVADFDGDTFADIAVANLDSNDVTVLLGDGTGSFTPSVSGAYAAQTAPAALAVTDLQGLGWQSLVVVNSGDDDLSFLVSDPTIPNAVLSSSTSETVPYGAPIDLTLTLTPNGIAFRAPTGGVDFNDGESFLGSATETASPYHFTASNLAPGTHFLRGVYNGDTRTLSANDLLTRQVSLATQTITFFTLSDRAYSNIPFSIAASAHSSSGLPVSFSSISSGVCTVSSTGVVTLAGVGTCSIQADQSGDATYAPAATQTQTFTVNQGSQTITFDTIPDKFLGSSPFVAAVESNSQAPVTVASQTTSVCINAGTLITILTAGTCTLQATQAGNSNFTAATPVSRSFAVTQAGLAGTLTTLPGSPISVSLAPYAVVTADFNGDGYLDFATVNTHANTVSIHLANSSHIFHQPAGDPFSVGNSPFALAVGDFNGDGKIDLATADQADSKVTILLGAGDGTFTALSEHPGTAFGPNGIAVADFDGDGIQDLIVTSSFQNSVSILKGDGLGGFSALGNNIGVGTTPAGVVIGDFNKDGKQDFATANSDSNDVTVLLNNGSGTFTPATGSPFAVGTHPIGIATADLNHDGNLDLVVTNGSAATVSVLLGTATGSFPANTTTSFNVSSSPSSVVLGDFNGDGYTDIATANFAAGNITLLFGDNNGGFSAQHGFSGIAQPYGLAAGDVNGDGVNDLLVSSIPDNDVTIFTGALAGTHSVLSSGSPTNIAPNSTVSLTLNVTTPGGSFNPPTGTVTFTDGSTTLGTSSQTSSPFTFTTPQLAAGAHTITATFGGGAGTASSVSNSLAFNAQLTQTITFNTLSDRPMDVSPFTLSATASSGLSVQFAADPGSTCSVTGTAVTLVSVGTCTIRATQPGDGSTYAAATDVVRSFTITQGSQTILFSNIPNKTIGISPFEIGVQATSLLPVSISTTTPTICKNASGLITLVGTGTCILQATQSGNANFSAAAPATTSFVVSQALPSGGFSGNSLTVGNLPYTVAVADINGDGIADLAMANSGDSTVSVQLGVITGGFSAAGTYPTGGLGSYGIAAGDFNGDGYADVAVENLASGDLSILLGSSSGALTAAPGSPLSVSAGIYTMAVGDFNNDGIQDLVIPTASSNIVVLTGDGKGGFTPLSPALGAEGAFLSVTVGDMNRDGNQDIIAVDNEHNQAVVFLGSGAGTFTSLSFPVGAAPSAVAAGDLDNDGFPDLVVSNQGGGNVTVLLGDGSPSLLHTDTNGPFATGIAPSSVAIGDFNGDGEADIAVGFVGGSGLSVLLNQGSAIFGVPGPQFVMPTPFVLQAFDLNRDGILDLVSSTPGTNAVNVLLGGLTTTTSALSPSPLTFLQGTPTSLALTVNGVGSSFNPVEGTATLFEGANPVASAPETTSPFSFDVTGLSVGTHTLQAHFIGTGGNADSVSNTVNATVQSAQTISFGPLSDVPLGAGTVSLSATASSGLSVTFSTTSTEICSITGTTVRLISAGQCLITASQTGDGIYGPATPVQQTLNILTIASQTITFYNIPNKIYGASPFTVVAKSDSGLTVSFASSDTSVCTTAGTLVTILKAGTCSIQATQAGNSSYSAAAAVSRSFVISTSLPKGTLSQFVSPLSIGDGPSDVAAADFNNDGKLDFVVPDSPSDSAAVFLANGSGGYASPIHTGTGHFPQAVLTGDFNRDGNPDFVTLNLGSINVTSWLGDGTGGFTAAPGNPFTTGTGGFPSAGVVGDFDGDSIPDLAVINRSSSLIIMIGNGSGGFTARPSISVGSNPYSVTIGDFNRDGKQDLAIAVHDDNNVRILLGNGDGTFTPATTSTYNVGSAPYAITATDFNNDGITDLAVANSGSGDMTILIGDGAGGFTKQAQSPVAVGPSPEALTAGDFNGDGFVDVALALTNNQSAIVMLNNGDGSFIAGPTFTLGLGNGFPNAVLATDIDGDGAVDLAATNGNGGVLTLLRSAPALTTSSLSTTSPLPVAAGTQVPLTVTVAHPPGTEFNPPAGTVRFYEGATQLGTAVQSGSPFTFTTGALTPGQHTIIAVFSSSDLRSVPSTSNSLIIPVLQAQTITFNQPQDVALTQGTTSVSASASSGLNVTFSSSTTSVCDVSGSLVSLFSGGACTITASQGGDGVNYSPAASVTRTFNVTVAQSQTITFAPVTDHIFGGSPFLIAAQSSSLLPVTYTSTTPFVCKTMSNLVLMIASGLCTIEATQPGNTNFSAATPVSRSFTIRNSLPSGTVISSQNGPYTTGTSPNSLALGDFNGDGYQDIVTANGQGGTVSIFLANSNGLGGFTAAGQPIAVGSNPLGVVTGDFNGDGKIDIATVNQQSNNVSVLLGTGLGTFNDAPNSPRPVGSLPRSLAAGDFNGDGIADLVVADTGANLIHILFGDGSGRMAGGTIPGGNSPNAVAVGDFNGDGTQDLAIANDGGSIQIMTNDGTGVFSQTSQGQLLTASGSNSFGVGDFNGDEFLDLAVGNGNSTSVSIYLNDGAGNFSQPNGGTISLPSNPGNITVGDYNGDGQTDLAITTGTNMVIAIGQGDGKFTPIPGFAVGAAATSAIAWDFNNDGLLDVGLVVASTNSLIFQKGGLETVTATLSTTAQSPVTQGTSVPLTLTLAPVTPAFKTPTGYVTFFDGSSSMGSASQTQSPYSFSTSGLGVGSHTISAVYGGDLLTTNTGSNTISLTVQGPLTPQTITFNPIASQPFNNTPLTLTATASSNLKVSYSSTTQSICSVTGSVVSFVNVGLCSITASQAGDTTYAPAANISQSFNITQGTQFISFAQPPDSPLSAGSLALSVSVSSNLTVSLVSATTNICTVSSYTVSFNAAGSCSITASQDGNSNYAAATSVTRTFNITAGISQTITFDTIPDRIFGGSPFVIAAQSSANLPITFASLTPSICRTASNLVTMITPGDCQIQASQPGVQGISPATPVTRTFKANQAVPGGGFTPATGSPYTAGILAQSAALLDFNNDGFPDIAVALAAPNGKIALLQGSSTGAYTAVSGITLGSGGSTPYGIAIGDFNADGYPDGVSANQGADNSSIVLGGQSGFAVGSVAAGSSPDAVAIGDFNGDGMQDYVVANGNSNNLTVQFGHGDGSFTVDDSGPFAVGTNPRAVAVADFDGDGKQDLLVANLNTNNVTILRGSGSGGFTPFTGSPIAVGTSPIAVVVGDFNLDGKSDFAVANSGGTGSISVFLGVGDGTFAQAGAALGASKFESLAVSDFNGDGIPDIAAATYAGSGSFTILQGNGQSGFTLLPSVNVASFPTSILADDLDHDGIADIVTVNSGNGSVSVLRGVTQTATPQTITFAPLSDTTFSPNPLTLSATASSGLAVTFTSTTTNICTVASTSLTMVTVGTCSITASQAGDTTYSAASDVVQSFNIARAAQIITFAAPPNVSVGAHVDLSATTSASLPVSFFSESTNVCSVSGTSATALAPGTCVIVANQSGNSNYNPISTSRSFTVSPSAPQQSPQTITFPSIGNTTVGTPPFGISASASSGLPVSFNSNTPGVCSVSGSTVSVSAAGTCSITASQSGNDQFSAADPVTQSFSVTVQINITTSSLPSGTVSQPYSAAVVATGGSGTLSWSIAGGSLPDGISLGSGGSIGGTPTAAGSFSFIVKAADNSGSSATQALGITINPTVTITTTGIPNGVQGVAYSQTLAASGGTGKYSWSVTGGALPGGITLSNGGSLAGTPTATGAFSFTAEVSDGVSKASQSYSMTIAAPLSITSSGALTSGITGKAYSGGLSAKGGNGGPYTWSVSSGSLPPGIKLSAGGQFGGNPSAAGSYSFTVQATDGVSPPATSDVSIAVFDQLSITTLSLPNGTVGTVYAGGSLTAAGGSGTFAWSASGLPAGLTLSSAGSLGGTPTAVTDAKPSFTVTDNASGQSLTAAIPVSVVASGPGLKVSPSTLTTGAGVGNPVSGTFTVSGGTAPYKFSATGLPAGVTLGADGSLSGSSTAAGTYNVTVTVTDSASTPATASAQLAIQIVGITTSDLSPGAATVLYTATFEASGGTPPYVFSAAGLPDGLTVSGAGALSGTAPAQGTIAFTVKVADRSGFSTTRSYSLVMAKPPVSAKSQTLGGGTVNTPYSDILTASGGTAPYSWSLISGALPAGLSLSSSGTISGIPTAPGTISFGVQVTDSTGGVASGGASITIAPAPVVITTGPLPSGVVNFSYGPQILDITGGVAPYQFAITGGALPPGLSFANGVIGGTPQSAGTFPFTLTVTDSASNKADAQSSIVIRPPASDLILLSGSVGFSLAQGAGALPSPESVGVQSTVVSDTITYSVTSTSAPWLSVNSSGTTPGALTVGLTNAALSLSAGTNKATVTVTCTSSTCQGKTQTVSVSLTVTSPPPQLSVPDDLISFTSAATPPQAQSQPLQIQNIGGGVLTIASITCGAPWCSVGSVPTTLAGGTSAQVIITASPAGLASGFYRTSVEIATSAGNASVPVSFFITQTATMTLAPSGAQFVMAAGGKPGNANGSFLVSIAGNNVNWSAALLPGANWLTLSTASGTSSSTTPGSVSYSINSNAASLAAGAYYATIEVTSDGASNSPQDYQVILNVSPASQPAQLDPEPGGLLFLTTSGVLPGPQVATVYTTSATPISYQASASTTDGGKWLSVSPGGTASASAPGQSTVTVNPGGLNAGVYTGGVSFATNSSGVRTINVTLIVQGANALVAQAEGDALAPRASCSAAKVVATQTGLVNSFSTPASWPTALSVQLSDDCGNVISNGQVVATFSNGDPPLAFNLANSAKGIYSGTWTPRNSTSNVTINARGTKTGLTAAITQLAGAVVPNATPTIDPNGVVHPFDPLIGGSLSPGTIVAIYGAHLGSQVAQPSTVPLPTKLNGTTVLIGGIPSPLFYVSPSQINVQIPFELKSSVQYQVIVNANGALTTPQPIQLTDANPGLDTFPDGSLVAVHATDGSLISADSPAQPGEYVVLFLLGLGATDNPVTSGDSSSGTVLSHPTVPPSITINSNPVPVAFAGLAPGFVGLYQVNLQIPADQPGGNVVIGVSQGDVKGNSGILPIAY